MKNTASGNFSFRWNYLPVCIGLNSGSGSNCSAGRTPVQQPLPQELSNKLPAARAANVSILNVFMLYSLSDFLVIMGKSSNRARKKWQVFSDLP